MAGYYEERWSRAAIWCHRFAVFLIPFFLLVILLFRFGKIETTQLFTLVAVGLLIAILSLVFAMRAISDLWYKGYRGGKKMIRGLIITLIVLLPFGYFSYQALLYPLANDVATDTFNPPEYPTAATFRKQRVADGMNLVREYSDEYADRIILAYPKVQSRRYPAGAERVLEAVRMIVEDNEWPVTGTKGVPETEENDTELADNTQSEDGSAEDSLEALEDIYVEFVQRTLVFGFENDVVIRIVSEDQNTLVDVRSSSRWGRHDLGYNARLIENILQQLDTSLLGIAGEG